jgi:hypothetical protein
MINAKLKIKNEGQDGKWGNEESPIMAGCFAWVAGARAQVQSLKFKVQSHSDREVGNPEFEVLRSKTSFFSKRNDEALKPNF